MASIRRIAAARRCQRLSLLRLVAGRSLSLMPPISSNHDAIFAGVRLNQPRQFVNFAAWTHSTTFAIASVLGHSPPILTLQR